MNKTIGAYALLLAAAFGCAAPDPAKIKPIQTVYADRLEKVRIGMEKTDFQRVFPEAHVAAQNGAATAYAIALRQVVRDTRRPVDSAMGFFKQEHLISDQSLWFYFIADKLVKWGAPNDWRELTTEPFTLKPTP